MIPKMSRYLDRLYATIHSRQEITVEECNYSAIARTRFMPGA